MLKRFFALFGFIIITVLAVFALNSLAVKTSSAQDGERAVFAADSQATAIKASSQKDVTVAAAPSQAQQVVGIEELELAKAQATRIYEASVAPKYEMRGVWVATVLNIDMPAGMDEAAFTAWTESVCTNAADKKMNAIIFQVKPTADALYKSELAPWSLHINGSVQGKDPGYDPLQIMLEKAHGKGIELHAWINPYRVTMASQKLDTLSKDSPAIKNPSWVIGYNNQFYLNPGLPEVRQYLVDCVAELVKNYDVDAVHMDDYFYPYPQSGVPFPDGDAYKKYGSAFATVEEWRRNNVNTLVAEVNRKIKEIKPYVQYGISPFGVWRNAASDPSGSATKAGVENYDSLHADTRQWLKDGSIDYLTPQIYWSRISQAANYSVLIDWWNNEVLKYTSKEHGGANVHPVNLYVGLADYKVGTSNDEAWEKSNTEISGQITDNYAKTAIRGQMHYNYSSVSANPLKYFDVISSANYKNIALTPPTPWNGHEYPKKAVEVSAEAKNNGLLLKMKADASCNNTRKFVVYRNNEIIGVVYNNGGAGEFLDKSFTKAAGYSYSVRTVSYTGVESSEAVEMGVVGF